MGTVRVACVGLGASLWSLLVPRGASAHDDDQKGRCLAAYEDAQRLRKQGKLLGSSEKLNFCASPACPRGMQPDCEQWSREVEESVPTVVFDVRAQTGESLAGASVSIDAGEARVLGGDAMRVDPGEHQVSFACPGFEPLERSVLFREGSKLQVEHVALRPLTAPSRPISAQSSARASQERTKPSAPASSARNATLLGSLVASSAITLAGAGGFTYFGLRARSGERALDSCAPDCARSRIDQVKQDYLFANVSLVATVAAGLATGAVFIISRVDANTASSAARSTLILGPTTVWTTAF